MASFKIDEAVFDKLAEILKKHNLSEVEYKDGDAKIRICATCNAPAPQSINILAPQQSNETFELHTPTDLSSHKGAVKSPMVGTCYTASEPGAANFVNIGDVVQEGQPILIIEAMKVMNMIKSPRAGKVIHIAVANGDPIEYGQLLVVVE